MRRSRFYGLMGAIADISLMVAMTVIFGFIVKGTMTLVDGFLSMVCVK